MLKNIANNGTEEQRRRALRELSTTSTNRTLRAIRLATPHTAKTLAEASVPTQKHRIIYDAEGTRILPGKVVLSEGEDVSNIKDEAVREAYEGLGDTYDFFLKILKRDSIDNNGMSLHATVHYDEIEEVGEDVGTNNAFFDGERMLFGDGDGELFNRFTLSLDVIGHELAHGVTEVESQLIYFKESGALNESMSDVFGSLVKQFKLGRQSADEADWLIGAGLFTDKVNGVALRSMKDPGSAFDDELLGKDPQPAHMDDFVETFQDNGGVHINSGIPNKAFFLVAVAIGGFAGDVAGRIWYNALLDPRLKPNATFLEFAQLTVDAAKTFSPDGDEYKIVQDAWRQVGVEVIDMEGKIA